MPDSIAARSRSSSSPGTRPREAIASAPPSGSAPTSPVERRAGQRWVRAADHADAHVVLQLGARVGDVEVAHGQLADPIGRAERGVFGPLHGELVRVIAEGRTGGVKDRVVLTAPQPQGHLAGDGRRDPALQRLAQHQRLRVEPAALVQQPAQPPPLVVVAGQGVLVVDRVDQPLVRRVQQRHARRLVDAAALGLDDPVLDLVGHAQAVPAADGVGLEHQVDGGGELLAVDGHRPALLEADRDVLRRNLDAGSQNRTPMIGSTISMPASRCSSALASWSRPDVRIGGVGLLRAVPVGQAAASSRSDISEGR